MKRKLTSLAAILLIFTTILACKKEDTNSQKYKMYGRWQVSKIETTSNGVTTTENFTSADYLDFKNNTEDELEVKLGSLSTKGNYVVLMGGTFNLSFNGSLLYCNTTNISDTNFQFTATVDKAPTPTTQTFYLSR